MIVCGVLPSAGAALSTMSTIIDDVVERMKQWPAWRQADAVYLLEMLEESGTDIYRLSGEERSAENGGSVHETDLPEGEARGGSDRRAGCH